MAQAVQFRDKATERQLKELVTLLRLSQDTVLKLATEQLWLAEGEDHKGVASSGKRSRSLFRETRAARPPFSTIAPPNSGP
jgi:hypothetical protein